MSLKPLMFRISVVANGDHVHLYVPVITDNLSNLIQTASPKAIGFDRGDCSLRGFV